jgi:hypothetical protein
MILGYKITNSPQNQQNNSHFFTIASSNQGGKNGLAALG